MKIRELVTENIIETSQEDIDNLKNAINLNWNEFYTAEELAQDIEQGFIFGKYARNKHYTNTYILELINEIDVEKNPPPVVEPQPEVILPPTDEQVLDKLVQDGIVTQEAVDDIIEELTPDTSLEEPLIGNTPTETI